MEGVERRVSKLGTSQIAGPWGPAEEVGIHSESSKHEIDLEANGFLWSNTY